MRRIKFFISVFGIFLMMSSIVMILYADTQQSAKELYEAAVFKKDADGDLKGAIEIFSKILVQFPNDRKIASKAQLQIGVCYEKLGQTNIKHALAAFQKVINNYPQQFDEVTIAKQKLMDLQRAAIPSKAEKPEFTIKKIWTGPEADGLGKISPDGRFIAFTDWTTGDLAVLDLTTGKKNRLTNKGNWMKSQEFALFLAWSPDGKQIAYNWWGATSYIDMRVIDASGSKPPRIVHNMKNPESGGAFIIGWTPDGKSVVTAFAEESGLQGRLSLVSIENGSRTHHQRHGCYESCLQSGHIRRHFSGRPLDRLFLSGK